MKKQIYLILLLVLPFIGNSQTIDKEQLRSYFLESIQRKSALDSFLTLMDKKQNLSTYEECYLGICQAIKIQYMSGMWSKYKMLDKSRDNIHKAVCRAPQDAEIRFIRFMLEHNIPAFLGMSGDIHSDLTFIFDHPAFLDESPDLKRMAMDYMITSKRCSQDQIAILERSINDMKKQYAER
jgi:hypothetical protein